MFDYTNENIEQLTKSLTADRLSRYLAACNGNIAAALDLYVRNILLSAHIYGLVHGLEVILRNAFHAQLSLQYSTDNWFDQIQLDNHGKISVQRARQSLQDRRKPLTSGRMVAELTFGFWSSLTAKRYSQILWIPCLHKAFTGKAIGHKEASRRLEKIRDLRNRIAHLEPIIDRDLELEYEEILTIAGWICPVTANWLADLFPKSTLMSLLAEKPKS